MKQEDWGNGLCDFNVASTSTLGRRASRFAEEGELAKAISFSEDFLERMGHLYGEFYPLTLSAMFCVAFNYATSSDFLKALSLHEECLQKRRQVLGDSHRDTLTSIAAVFELESKISRNVAMLNDRASSSKDLDSVLDHQVIDNLGEDIKKSESPYDKMKTKNLIELIDCRKLNRVGLQEKSELAQLLCSNTTVVEKRGVTLKLFRAYRQLALSRNADASFWTIAHVSAMINGSHEVFKADCRFGEVDPNSTLTFDDKCPLIDVLLFKNFDSNNKHPLLNLSYKEAVGEQANLFISFAYKDNFIDLVDALELYLETHSEDYPVDTTYFWFDLFINNQWTASDKPFEFWASTFETMVNEIGHTLCFLSPWENPTILTRVWCLLEMRYSPRISIILSRREVASFHEILRKDYVSVSRSLSKINVENATSFIVEDKVRIFKVIEAMKGGVHEFNVKVMELIREWTATYARQIAAVYKGDFTLPKKGSVGLHDIPALFTNLKAFMSQLEDLSHAAHLLKEQERLDEAKELYNKALCGYERLIMRQDSDAGRVESIKLLVKPNILIIKTEIALILQMQGQLGESNKLLDNVLTEREQLLGPDDYFTLLAANALGSNFYVQGRLDVAKKLFERALHGLTRAVGRDHNDTLQAVNNLAMTLNGLGQVEEAKKLYERALSDYERVFGPDYGNTLWTLGNLATILSQQGKYDEARKLWEKALSSQERVLGRDHLDTLVTVHNLANIASQQMRVEDATKLNDRALSAFERTLGYDHAMTLRSLELRANLFRMQGRTKEATALFSSVLAGFERALGPDHANTLQTIHNLALLLKEDGQLQGAKKLFERALSGFARTLGPDHEKTKMVSRGLASLKK